MKAVVLQPTYLSWIGYFGLIDVADIFVFYDDVQFVKQSWQQRNKIKAQKGEILLTVPVIQDFGQKINEVKINSIYYSVYHNRHYLKNLIPSLAPYAKNYPRQLNIS